VISPILLGLAGGDELRDDDTGKLAASSAEVDVALGGAWLVELALMRRIDVAGRDERAREARLVARNPSPTGDSQLDEALTIVGQKKGKNPQVSWHVSGSTWQQGGPITLASDTSGPDARRARPATTREAARAGDGALRGRHGGPDLPAAAQRSGLRAPRAALPDPSVQPACPSWLRCTCFAAGRAATIA